MGELTNISCGNCGVAFCLPTSMYHARVEDGHSFYCPNGHRVSYRPSEEQKRIAELERHVEQQDRHLRQLGRAYDETIAQREDLIRELKQCPGRCGWHSRRQVPRDPVAMGRGLERVRLDVIEHLIHEHGVGVAQRLIEERT